ncbi:MAG TPA: phosphatidylinositol mannoside acyltransferase [Propionibacteriaceae bacterium]|nr:phosphatidylinositol mannoside acyltransferase [Propionibacteriaceae bacterium]
MSGRRDAAVRTLYRVGWRSAPRIPAPAVAGLISAGSALAAASNGPHVQTLRANLSAVTGQVVSTALVRAALASYLRNFHEVLTLPAWPADRVLEAVTTTGEETLRNAFATRGAVVALPHSGNWDLAGAWACRTGMPVTTVAEQLAEPEFRAFVAFRESLGMAVLSHTDPATLPALIEAARSGRLVCLVADRDLAGTGVPVIWAGHQITMPGGPALVARRSGAALIPAVCSYTAKGMQIAFGAVVEERPGRAGLQAMTQEVASFFAAEIARRPEDWHMLQPFFDGGGAA